MSQVTDTFGLVGNTIKVAAGHTVDLSSPEPCTIDIYSIAVGLSKTCRFGGQCREFYSVAQHSVNCYELAKSGSVSEQGLLAILLHDAAEAYIGDVVKPLKVMLPGYVAIEQRLEWAIEEYFGVSFDHHRDVIKHYDRAMIKIEKQKFWPDSAEEWEGFSDLVVPEFEFNCQDPSASEFSFMQAFREAFAFRSEVV